MCKLSIQLLKRISPANRDPVLLSLLVGQAFIALAGHRRTPTLVTLPNSHLRHIYSPPHIPALVPSTHTGRPAPTRPSLNQQHSHERATATMLETICIPWSAAMQLVRLPQRGQDGRDFGKRCRCSTICDSCIRSTRMLMQKSTMASGRPLSSTTTLWPDQLL